MTVNVGLEKLNLAEQSEDHELGTEQDLVDHGKDQALVDLESKRRDYLSWDDYFMATAYLSAMRSKDPHTQVGAVIVNRKRRVAGIGYNGMPTGCDDDLLPWGKTDPDRLNNKYLYVCHAEMNAVLNKNSTDVEGCTIYTTLFPCCECAKIIVQSGIREVVYSSDKHSSKPEFIASRRIMAMAGIKMRQYVAQRRSIVIDLEKPAGPPADSTGSFYSGPSPPLINLTSPFKKQPGDEVLN